MHRASVEQGRTNEQPWLWSHACHTRTHISIPHNTRTHAAHHTGSNHQSNWQSYKPGLKCLARVRALVSGCTEGVLKVDVTRESTETDVPQESALVVLNSEALRRAAQLVVVRMIDCGVHMQVCVWALMQV